MLVDAIMNTDVATVSRDHTALRVARMMRDSNVGTVVVIDDSRRPIGILTDRDISLQIVASGESAEAAVDQIMSTPVIAVPENSLVFDVLREMSSRRVQRVPVVDRDGRLAGIVSIHDALLILVAEMNNIADVLGGRSRLLE